MGSRCVRLKTKEEKLEEVTIDMVIERLKKIRALNCNPSDIGMDDHLWKKFLVNRSNATIKFL